MGVAEIDGEGVLEDAFGDETGDGDEDGDGVGVTMGVLVENAEDFGETSGVGVTTCSVLMDRVVA